MMKVFQCSDNVNDAINSIIKYGIACFDCTKTPFKNMEKLVSERLDKHGINTLTSYQNTKQHGYLYFIFDPDRFTLNSDDLKQLVELIDMSELIQQRIADWKERISGLYETISEWLQDDNRISIQTDQSVQMNEELMHKLDIPSETLPVLHIYKDKQLSISIKPVGLWVIGANGRLDIYTAKESFFLVDSADHFQDPNWEISSPRYRTTRIPFTKEFISGLL